MKSALTIAALAATLLLVVLYRAFGRDPHAIPFGLKGKPAPPFTATDLKTGEPVTLEKLAGQPMVLNFWASWCGPCKAEHATVEWAAQTFGNRARFYGVVFEDTQDNAKAYLAERGSSFPQLYDPKSRMAVDYGTTGVPETYFIDARGVIVDKFVGPIDPQSMKKNIDAIAPAQAEARP
jgi:cytochrome c biogenesis protein CcmG/thiol:disulfide interchange protein DsbE